MTNPGFKPTLERIRGSVPTPVIILLAVIIIAGAFVAFSSLYHHKEKAAHKTENAAKIEAKQVEKVDAKVDETVTYAEFDNGTRHKISSRRADRNTRTIIKRKTTHFTAAGTPTEVTEIETTIDDSAKLEQGSEQNEQASHTGASVTDVTATATQTTQTTATSQASNRDASSASKETGRDTIKPGKAGLAVTSGGHPAITWDVAKIGQFAGQTILEVDPTKAGIRAGGIGLAKDITRDGRFYAGAHTLYGKEDGVKTGIHIGVRF